MNELLDRATWPLNQTPAAIHALADRAGLRSRFGADTVHIPAAGPESLRTSAHWCGVEVAPVRGSYGDLEWVLQFVPVLLLQRPDARGWLAVVRTRGGRCVLVGPDACTAHVAIADVVAALVPSVASTLSLDDALSGLPPRLRRRAGAALVRDRLAGMRLSGCWTIGPRAGDARGWLQRANVPSRLTQLLAAHIAQYGCWVMSWWVIGGAALSGRAEEGWFIAWALLLASMVPLRALVSRLQGTLAVTIGSLLKRRLMAGALAMPTDQARLQGVGHLLGCVLESESIETLTLSGGFLAVFAALELGVSAVVIAGGAGGLLQLSSLVVWTALVGAVAWRYYRKRRAWTAGRLTLTHDLVERLIGYRTVLAQQPPQLRHVEEDAAATEVAAAAARMDRTEGILRAIGHRGWLLIGIGGLIPAFTDGTTSASLAIGLGGVLLAHQAFRRLVTGFGQLAGAAIAWDSVRPLFESAALEEPATRPDFAAGAVSAASDVVAASDLVFRYRPQSPPALAGCSLVVQRGDRMLIEGPSGGGKSTLAMVLAGLRKPEHGLVLVNGLDLGTVGAAGWRRAVAVVPQFHENHVFTATLAFNLLMGRRWPPSREDMADAEAVCKELGLGDLLNKLPSKLLQMVGETGWHLSHGERTRVFIARAILQRSDLVIFDESFADLDPATVQQAMQCVKRRATTVMVIAHP